MAAPAPYPYDPAAAAYAAYAAAFPGYGAPPPVAPYATAPAAMHQQHQQHHQAYGGQEDVRTVFITGFPGALGPGRRWGQPDRVG